MRRSSGFTLIEVMIALVVLALGIVGSLIAVLAAGKELKEGQTRQVRSLLGDASARRFMLASKIPNSTFLTPPPPALTAACPTPCSNLAISAAPWALDTTPIVAGDLSTGAYFRVFKNGEIERIDGSTNPAVVAGTPCSAVPRTIYCRELMVTRSPAPIVTARSVWTAAWPPPASPAVPATSSIYTVWIRIAKGGDTPAEAIYFTDSFVQ